MKKIMLMGRVSCGKTTLCQCLAGMELRYQKTQTVQLVGDAIDTPGEYVENRALMRGLTVTNIKTEKVYSYCSIISPLCSIFPRYFLHRFWRSGTTNRPAPPWGGVVGDAIDTPGEYVENRALMRGLTVTAVDADAVLFLQDCTDPECRFSPGHTLATSPVMMREPENRSTNTSSTSAALVATSAPMMALKLA